MKVVIQIDRLVLEGISANAAERARIRTSVENELARLIGEQGAGDGLRSGGAVPSMPAPAFGYRRESPRGTGEQIARSVYASLKNKR
jgi:hypothetical protein